MPWLIVSLMIPGVIVCSLFADEIIVTLLGPKWNGVSPVVRRSLNIALLIAPVVILGILAGLRHGPTGAAMGYSAAMLLLSVPLVAWAKHGTGITTGDFLNTIKDPLLAGAGGAAVGWAFKVGVRSFLPPFVLLVLGVTLSLAVYAYILLFVLNQKSMYVDLLSQLIPRNRTAPAAN
jgi:PST family polysaccharide transporter